jgi:glycine cleavage system H protein
MKHYSKDHEWVQIEDEVATMGITEYAANELEDVTFVELPEVGANFDQGEAMAVVESVKAASDVFAPVSGKVIEVNEALADSPELVNESPEEDGWFCKLEDIDEGEFDNLMNYIEYQKYVEEEKGDEEEDQEEDEE